MSKFWSRTMIHYTRYTEEDIMPVVEKLALALLANADEKTPKYRVSITDYHRTYLVGLGFFFFFRLIDFSEPPSTLIT